MHAIPTTLKLIILLSTRDFSTMENLFKNNILWNKTHSVTRSYDYQNVDSSFIAFENNSYLQNYNSGYIKYKNSLNNKEPNVKTSNNTNKSQKIHHINTTLSFNNKTFINNENNIIKFINPFYGKFIEFKNKTKMPKKCENDCNVWKPLNPMNIETYNNLNQSYINIKNRYPITNDSLLIQLKSHMNYNPNTNTSNKERNELYKDNNNYGMRHKNWNCSRNNITTNIVIGSNYSTTETNNEKDLYNTDMIVKKKPYNNDDRIFYHPHQIDDSSLEPYDDSTQDYNAHDEEAINDGTYNKNDRDHSLKVYPRKSYPLESRHGKWGYKPHFRYKYVFSGSNNWHYCKKYCRCCKKPTKYGSWRKLLHFLKYLGFNSGYNYFYGRSSHGYDYYNPLSFIKHMYHKYYDYDHYDSDYIDDESYMISKHHHDNDWDDSHDCGDICDCCDDNKIEIVKESSHGFKLKKKTKWKKIRGISELLRHLIFSKVDEGRNLKNDYIIAGKKYDHDYHYDHPYDNDHHHEYDHNHEYDHHHEYEPIHEYDHHHEYEPIHEYDHHHEYEPIHEYDHHEYNDNHEYDPHDDYDHHHEYDVHDYDPHHYHHAIEEHHHDHIFDCSRCCRLCKKPSIKIEVVKRRKRRRRRRNRFNRRGLLGRLKNILRGRFFHGNDEDDDNDGDDDDDDDDDNDDGFSDGDDSNPSRNENSNGCCTNSTTINSIIVLVVIAIIVIQNFSSLNIIFVIIIPLIFFGIIIIFIFLLLQSIIPIYFLPIFLLLVLPIILPLILFSLLLPASLFPVFFPFILRLNNTAPFQNLTVPSTMRSTIQLPTITPFHTNASEDYESSSKTFDNVTYDVVLDYEVEGTESPADLEERVLQNPNSLYWKINSALRLYRCLERAGCHLAVYSHPLKFYNKFIFRILENLSLTIDDSRFTAYKDAYQIGTLNVTDHEMCRTLYFCEVLDPMFKRIIN